MERTDPEIADEIVATVRRFVERDVLPVASGLEHADEYPEALAKQMEALGLFGAWSGSDEVRRVKPDPEVLHLTLRKLGRPAEGAAYVGDTPLDIRSARSAGLASVAVLGGTGSREELEASGPDAIIERFADLKELFLKRGDKG